jgi:hypothetical protein
MQAPVEKVREDLRRLQDRGGLDDKVPPDVAVRWVQVRSLLFREPEFEARYPAAYTLLLEPHFREIGDELIGISLPSFGVRILQHAPKAHGPTVSMRDRHHDTFSSRYSGSRKMEGQTPLADQDYARLDTSYLRGLLLDILGRDEYWERVHVRYRDPDLQDRVGAPNRAVVRITDLRLALDLDPDELKTSLIYSLNSLKRPFTAEGVVQWKQQVLDVEADLKDQGFEDRKVRTAAMSFAAAALLLFLDLDMPGAENEKSSKLDDRIWSLAQIIRKLAASLDDGADELEKLIAARKVGEKARFGDKYYEALTDYRLGLDPKELIAPKLGYTPYDYETNKGSTSWKKRIKEKLAVAEEIEREKYPRAAAIFANKDNEHVQRKALQAYDLFTENLLSSSLPGVPSASRERWDWWGVKVGKKLNINTRTKRGREITKAYVDLGYFIKNGAKPPSSL